MTRLVWTLPDGQDTARWAEDEGGGSQPDGMEEISNEGTTTIGNGATGELGWRSIGPDTLLDLTDPTAPVYTDGGTLAITMAVLGTGLTPDGWFQVDLFQDFDNIGPQATGQSRLATAADPSPICCVTLLAKNPPGGVIVCRVQNHDGVAARDFIINLAIVQQV